MRPRTTGKDGGCLVMKGSGSGYRHDKDYNPSAAAHEEATGAVHTDA